MEFSIAQLLAATNVTSSLLWCIFFGLLAATVITGSISNSSDYHEVVNGHGALCLISLIATIGVGIAMLANGVATGWNFLLILTLLYLLATGVSGFRDITHSWYRRSKEISRNGVMKLAFAVFGSLLAVVVHEAWLHP